MLRKIHLVGIKWITDVWGCVRKVLEGSARRPRVERKLPGAVLMPDPDARRTPPRLPSCRASVRWEALTLSHVSFQRSGTCPSSISRLCSSCRGIQASAREGTRPPGPLSLSRGLNRLQPCHSPVPCSLPRHSTSAANTCLSPTAQHQITAIPAAPRSVVSILNLSRQTDVH